MSRKIKHALFLKAQLENKWRVIVFCDLIKIILIKIECEIYTYAHKLFYF